MGYNRGFTATPRDDYHEIVVTFLLNFASLVLPGRVPGFQKTDILLPCSFSKRSIWRIYKDKWKQWETYHRLLDLLQAMERSGAIPCSHEAHDRPLLDLPTEQHCSLQGCQHTDCREKHHSEELPGAFRNCSQREVAVQNSVRQMPEDVALNSTASLFHHLCLHMLLPTLWT